MKALVIGATGRVASHLAKTLQANGSEVRALVRNRAKASALLGESAALEIVEGAFDDARLLDRAFDGTDVAYLGLGTSQDQIALEKGLIDAAARSACRQLIRLSVFGSDEAVDYEVARRHGELDAYLVNSGVPNTRLRPTYFSSNLLLAATSIAAQDRWFGSAPTGRVAVIDTRDVAEAAAVVARTPSIWNKVWQLTGPEALTFDDVALRLSSVLDRKIQYLAVDKDTLLAGYAKRGVPDWLANIAVGIDRAMQEGRHAEVTTDFERLTKQSPRSLEVFLRDNRSAFSGSR